ncbi:hypothetical protein ABTX62_20155 [Streptomyces sp. NPDC096046]|uniref:hypothetical protein n=1 Tax=Streptomyces sp. NPDC096046 TaxID=3155542 RepID=UPI003320EA71
MDLEKRPRESSGTRVGPLERRAAERPVRREPEASGGCLAVAIRIPVRIIVLVLVVPVRMLWDVLVVTGRFLNDVLLRPLGRALLWLARAVFVWPFVGLWRYVVVPVGKTLGWLGNVLVVVPLVWLYRHVLTPVGHAIAWVARGFGAVLGWIARGVGAALGWVYTHLLTPLGHAVSRVLKGLGAGLAALGIGVWAVVAWLAKYLVAVPAGWLYTWVLAPFGGAVSWCGDGLLWLVSMIVTGIGTALYWIARVVLVLPALGLWRWILTPVGRVLAAIGREVWDALGHAWRVSGYISLAVGRFLGTLLRWIFVEPVRWMYRSVLTPVGHVVRDTVLRPAAQAARGVGRATRQALAAARQTRADIRRMLFGEPRQPLPADRREPSGREARSLGRSTTALTKD